MLRNSTSSILRLGGSRAITRSLMLLACAGLLLVAPSSARASELDKLSVMTFSNPVELPHVALPAGTYRFELADPNGDPSAVRVMSADGAICYGTFLTIPERANADAMDSSTPSVTLEHRVDRAPEAIDAWFYPGDGVGHEFIYPHLARSMR